MVMIKSIFLAFAELVLFSLNVFDLSVCVSLILKINSHGHNFHVTSRSSPLVEKKHDQ